MPTSDYNGAFLIDPHGKFGAKADIDKSKIFQASGLFQLYRDVGGEDPEEGI